MLVVGVKRGSSDLNTTPVKVMNIEWEEAVRRTLNLPRTTRSKLIPLLAGNRSFLEQRERRWGALYARMMQCEHILHEELCILF